jgi:hypothetical protein
LPGKNENAVIALAGEQETIAGAHVDGVFSLVAEDDISAGAIACDDRIIAKAGDQRVVAQTAVDRIIAAVAEDEIREIGTAQAVMPVVGVVPAGDKRHLRGRRDRVAAEIAEQCGIGKAGCGMKNAVVAVPAADGSGVIQRHEGVEAPFPVDEDNGTGHAARIGKDGIVAVEAVDGMNARRRIVQRQRVGSARPHDVLRHAFLPSANAPDAPSARVFTRGSSAVSNCSRSRSLAKSVATRTPLSGGKGSGGREACVRPPPLARTKRFQPARDSSTAARFRARKRTLNVDCTGEKDAVNEVVRRLRWQLFPSPPAKTSAGLRSRQRANALKRLAVRMLTTRSWRVKHELRRATPRR